MGWYNLYHVAMGLMTLICAVLIRRRRPLWRGWIVTYHARSIRPVSRQPDLWTPEEGI